MINVTTRSSKGAELTHAEVDANFTDIAAAVNFLAPKTVSYTAAVPLTGNLFMPQQTVSGAIGFTVAAGATAGAKTYVRLVSNGVNAPTFAGFKEWGGSAGYDNRPAIVNIVEFFFDGVDYWYHINQQVGAVAADTLAPTFVSAAIQNAAPAIVVLTMSESLAAFTPATSAFTLSGGKTVSAVALSGSTITLTASSAYANGDTVTVSYTQPGSNQLQDTAGNKAASFGPSAVTNNVGAVITAPGAPTIGAAVAGDGSASVAFTAPASNGGSAITGYTVTSSPGGFTGTGVASPITVSGLTNGTAYTFTATATNSVGTGSASAASNSVTPAVGTERVGRLALTGNIAESGDTSGWTYVSNGSANLTTAPTAYGILDARLPANTDGYVTFVNNTGFEFLAGFITGTTFAAFNTAGMPYAIFSGLTAGAGYAIFQGGASKTPLVTLSNAPGDIIKLSRVGTTVTASVARGATPGTFTNIYVWTGVATPALGVQIQPSDPTNVRPVTLSTIKSLGLS